MYLYLYRTSLYFLFDVKVYETVFKFLRFVFSSAYFDGRNDRGGVKSPISMT